MKPHRAGLLASGSALLVLLAACGGSAHPASQQQASNQVFTYDTSSPVMVNGWDPATEYSDGILAMSNMYETLTRYDTATHTIKPLLATSWSTSANGLTWTFHLRQGVHFHTGRLMTARAAAAAILRTEKLGGGAARMGRGKEHRRASTYTMVFHLKYPSPLDLQASSRTGVPPTTPAAAGSGSLTKWFNTPHDAGTGRYELQTWNKGQEFEVILKAFPGYWSSSSGPHFKKVVFRVVPPDARGRPAAPVRASSGSWSRSARRYGSRWRATPASTRSACHCSRTCSASSTPRR